MRRVGGWWGRLIAIWRGIERTLRSWVGLPSINPLALPPRDELELLSRGEGARGRVGRADLAQALHGAREGTDHEHRIAELMGYAVRPVRPIAVVPPSKPSSNPQTEARLPSPEALVYPATPFWRVEEVRFADVESPPVVAEPAAAVEVLTIADLGRDPTATAPRPQPPITPWPHLRRTMEEVTGWFRTVGGVDIVALTDRLSRGIPIVNVPRRRQRVRVRRLIVILDRADRLIPFWSDEDDVYAHLEAEFGQERIVPLRWKHGPSPHPEALKVDGAVGPGDAILVLSDLGIYGDEELRRTWLELGDALGSRGAAAWALIPCPAYRWPPHVRRSWRTIDWANPARAPQLGGCDPTQLERRRDRLLALLSLSVLTEPALIREIRAALPATLVDLGTEGDAWNHPRARAHRRGLVWSEELRRHAAAMFDTPSAEDGVLLSDDVLLNRVVAILRERHRSIPREIWMEEVCRILVRFPDRAFLRAEDVEQAIGFMQKVRAFVRDDPNARLAETIEIGAWAERMTGRLDEEAWNHRRLGQTLVDIRKVVGAGRPLPPGLTLQRLAVGESGHDGGVWTLRQVGTGLIGLRGMGSREAGQERGSPIATLFAGVPTCSVTLAAGRRAALHDLGERPEPIVDVGDEDEIVVATDAMDVVLRKATRPQWAHAAGRDRFGLWASFRVGEVVQRMRWIPPGRFWMGSPETEEGRDSWESRHQVTLTQGFWLADAPCTQALWEVVMGENPSRFRSPRRPVEQVSWDDVQQFVQRLNQRTETLDVGLPTEAQWEYACRAGTETSTYAGEMQILGDRNAPILDEITWYGGNSGVGYELSDGDDASKWPEKQHPRTRVGTRDVALKQPNAWGLYDMLGNVYEWCADAWSYGQDYDPGSVSDPFQADGPYRVIRGGSWDSYARRVRAAYRRGNEPGLRYDYLGFRLARGQGLR